MSQKHLGTYLNDHLAGSVAALGLLAHLQRLEFPPKVAVQLKDLEADIRADQQELKRLMADLDIAESLPKKAMAWLGEKLTEVKLRVDDSATGPFHLFESLEALSLGIEGKKALWKALSTASVGRLDYARLQSRADEQRRRAEAMRLEAAPSALRVSAQL